MKPGRRKTPPKPRPGKPVRRAPRSRHGATAPDGFDEAAGQILHVRGGKKYELGPLVARGGMGIVREARDLLCQRIVAMKVLPGERAAGAAERDRFMEEARITSQLEHPNIVPVHELGQDEQRNLFYTMKYVRGMTLTDIIRGIRRGDAAIVRDYPLARLLVVFQKVCDAVAFAHSRGVVHCDLKPDNIMICDFGEVVVTDWGLARRFEGASRPAGHGRTPPPAEVAAVLRGRAGEPDGADDLARATTVSRTTTGSILGTPGFIAPERLEDPSCADALSDVYSLGATLYSILTLRAPIAGKDKTEVIRRIVHGEIVAPVEFNRPRGGGGDSRLLAHCPDHKIPGPLSAIAMRALSLEPGDRYATVHELQAEVEAYQDGIVWHLVMDEDFSKPDIESRWQVIGGQWELRDGELRLSGGDPQVLILKKDLAGDVRIDVECRQEGGYLNDISAMISAVRSPSGREVQSSGYEFKFGAYDNSMNLLMRSDRRIWSEPASPLQAGKTYHVRAERMDAHLRLVVNDEEVFDVLDPDPLSGADRTVVGLTGWLADTRYKRIRVYALGAPWRADLLDLAERQLQKGNYMVATALYQEVMDSFPDNARLERAQRGWAIAQYREGMMAHLPGWRRKLQEAWPGVQINLRVNNDGLSLDISDTGIEDLSPLSDLPLNALYCQLNRIRSLEPLRGMTLLTLNASGNPVESLDPLVGMPLSILICEGCRIDSLEPLRGMRLTMLLAGGNRLTSLEPLRGMPLTTFNCWGNRLTELSPLAGMSLTMLSCNGNLIESLEAVRGMPLGTVNCAGNRISDLGPLEGMPLSIVHCSENRIASLDPLRGMPLSIVTCAWNRIENLQPLKGLHPTIVNCAGNPLTGLAPFVESPPSDFAFDCDTLPTREMELLAGRWARDFRTAHLARDVEAILALRRRDTARLRALSSEFRGRHCLHVPRLLTWEDARALCEELGGHLVTVTSEEKNAFLVSMFKYGCWFWMGLRTTERGDEWITGEPVAFSHFMDVFQSRRPGPVLFSGKWWREEVPDAHHAFMLEWDE